MNEQDFDFSAEESEEEYLRKQVEELEAEVKFWRNIRRINKLIENAEALEQAAKKCRLFAEGLQKCISISAEKYEVTVDTETDEMQKLMEGMKC